MVSEVQETGAPNPSRIAQLAELGIEPGVGFKLSNFDPQTQEAINAGFADGWKELGSYRDKMGEKINVDAFWSLTGHGNRSR